MRVRACVRVCVCACMCPSWPVQCSLSARTAMVSPPPPLPMWEVIARPYSSTFIFCADFDAVPMRQSLSEEMEASLRRPVYEIIMEDMIACDGLCVYSSRCVRCACACVQPHLSLILALLASNLCVRTCSCLLCACTRPRLSLFLPRSFAESPRI